MKVRINARTIRRATLFVTALAVSAHARTMCAQTPPTLPDSATLYSEAQRLSSRADTLVRGSVSDRRVAVDLLRQAAELFSTGGARRDAALTLNRIGNLYRQSGQPDSALVQLWHALPIARATGDRATEARILNSIGAVFIGIGQPDSALTYFRQALPMARAVSDRTGEARTLNNIGVVFGGIGQRDSAFTYFRLVLAIHRAEGNRTGEAGTLNNIGLVLTFVNSR